jgi:DNA-binding SARP family transcriptional activator
MPTLHFQLLGNFQLIYNGEPAPRLNHVRLQSLLGYLALHRNAPQMRQHLAALLWPQASAPVVGFNLDQLYRN